MSSELEPVIWLRVLVRLAYMKGRADVRCTYVRTVDDVMAIKPNFIASMGYQYFLSYGAPLHAPTTTTTTTTPTTPTTTTTTTTTSTNNNNNNNNNNNYYYYYYYYY